MRQEIQVNTFMGNLWMNNLSAVIAIATTGSAFGGNRNCTVAVFTLFVGESSEGLLDGLGRGVLKWLSCRRSSPSTAT